MTTAPRAAGNRELVQLGTYMRPLAPDATARPIWANLLYDPGDPYAVRIRFEGDEPGHTVTWLFARDLLAAGLDEPVGLGDVRIWPWSSPRGQFIALSLSSPEGSALYEAPRNVLARFLRRSYAAVPRGREGDQLDLDAVLADLLREL